MIRFGICDDDIEYMKSIIQIIVSAYEENENTDESCECILYNSGKTLIDKYIEDKIDIFFLDIECGDMSGFDIARELLKRKKDVGIVYITNYQHYISSSFVCRPLGFIHKNDIEDDIKVSMLNVMEFLEERRQRITFTDNKGEIELRISDIVVVEVFSHELKITLADRIIKCKGQLTKYEYILIECGFIKIARGILVNRKFITKISGDQIYLGNNIKYNISRRRVLEVKRNWKEGREHSAMGC